MIARILSSAVSVRTEVQDSTDFRSAESYSLGYTNYSMVEIICALCGKKQQTEILYPQTFQREQISPQLYCARRKPDHVHYQILRCRRCGLVFSSPILLPAKIARFYRSSLCTYEEQIPFATETYLELFERAVSNLGDLGSLRVLEIGCGNGFFLSALWERGVREVFGVEPSKKMVSDAPVKLRKRIITDIFRAGQFPKNHFDLVSTFHTLDHIVDVSLFMEEVFFLLKKGGVFLAVVHDTEGLSVKLLGERSPIFDIEHIFLFNRETLRKLCEKFGFWVIDVVEVQNKYPLSYWLKMLGVPEKLVSFLRIPISLRAGNIAVVARKP